MKIIKIIAVQMLFLFIFYDLSHAENTSNINGSIDSIEFDVGQILINGNISGGSGILEFSLITNNGTKDYLPKNVYGKFRTSFAIIGIPGGTEYVIKLWAREARDSNGKLSLEGLLDEKRGRLSNKSLSQQQMEKFRSIPNELRDIISNFPDDVKRWNKYEFDRFKEAREKIRVLEDLLTTVTGVSSGSIDSDTLEAAKRTIDRWNEFSRRKSRELEEIGRNIENIWSDKSGGNIIKEECNNVENTIFVSAERTWPDVWTDTGINLVSGNNISISASGRVGYDSSSDTVDPDGILGHPGGPLRSANAVSLIAKIGSNGSPFFLGSNYSDTVSSNGRLYLSINDSSNMWTWRDNTGSFRATIKYCE